MMPFEFLNEDDLLRDVSLIDRASILQQLGSSDFDGCLKDFTGAPLDLAEQLLPLARAFSMAPVSGFSVGAIAVGASKRLYLGANLEFIGVPLSASLHAEQSAVLNAWMHGEAALHHLVVSAAPCGHCRQFLWELPNADQLSIHFEGKRLDLSSLLPAAFGESRRKGASLMDSPECALEPVGLIRNDLEAIAVGAAKASYTPYTAAPEGVALQCINGTTFSGRTAESVAFNPTVSALVCALNQRNFSSSREDAISRCVHAKLVTSLSSQESFSKSLLSRMSHLSMETILMEAL